MICSAISYFLKFQTRTGSELLHEFEVRKLKIQVLKHVKKKSILQTENHVNSVWVFSC